MIESTSVSESFGINKMNTDNQIVDRNRAMLYGVLGHLFNFELTPEFVEEFQQAGFFDMLTRVEPGFTVKKNLNNFDFESLAVEFARLFVGPGPIAPPYASVYLENDKRSGELWGEKTGEVKRFMAHYGLELDKPGIIPDHISVLFEFLEKVLRAKIDANARGDHKACQEADKIRQQFYRSYLMPWIERFLQRVLKSNPLSFYAALVKFTREFVAEENVSG